MDLLARREQSRLELSQKLNRRFADQSEEIIRQIDQLTSQGLQSDARLAEAMIRARTNKGQGPVKIKMELKGKGVAEEVISLAFEAAEVDWFELARVVAVKKFSKYDPTEFDMSQMDSKAKARVSRFLQQRGFNFEHISNLT